MPSGRGLPPAANASAHSDPTRGPDLPGGQQAGCPPTLTRIKLPRDASDPQCLGNKEIPLLSPQAAAGRVGRRAGRRGGQRGGRVSVALLARESVGA